MLSRVLFNGEKSWTSKSNNSNVKPRAQSSPHQRRPFFSSRRVLAQGALIYRYKDFLNDSIAPSDSALLCVLWKRPVASFSLRPSARRREKRMPVCVMTISTWHYKPNSAAFSTEFVVVCQPGFLFLVPRVSRRPAGAFLPRLFRLWLITAFLAKWRWSTLHILFLLPVDSSSLRFHSLTSRFFFPPLFSLDVRQIQRTKICVIKFFFCFFFGRIVEGANKSCS